MLCDDCHKNEACIHITQISPEGKIDKNLCEKCASRYGNFMQDPESEDYTVNDFLKGIFSKSPREESTVPQGLVCPNCGMTYQDFVHSGKIGCSVCYSTFRKQLIPFLKRIHGSVLHSGKIPKRSGGALVVQHEIDVLKEQLQMAVKSEEYEKAAEYRDRIRSLEQKLAAEREGAESDGSK
ncbi:MAG: UvrB/UvrC motif-containing protein [Schwartzia sp.]|nr:UvrB/UvrC motif-containing protein [Schwartzia sp. (in: firmicutes)]